MKVKPNVLLVGGEGRKNILLKKKIEAFGVKVSHIWEARVSYKKKKIPKKVDLILIMVDYVSHGDQYNVKRMNAGELPLFMVSKNMPSIAGAIAKYFGFEPPKKGGRNQSREAQRQAEKIRQAAQERSMPFASWVEEVQVLRGSPLTQGDPYRAQKQAYDGETWYDIWLQGVEPQKAAKLGSRNLL
jgi:hypothetical protein